MFVVIARFATTKEGIVNVNGPFDTAEAAEAFIASKESKESKVKQQRLVAAGLGRIYSIWPVNAPEAK